MNDSIDVDHASRPMARHNPSPDDEKRAGCTDLVKPFAIEDVCAFRDKALAKMHEAIGVRKQAYALTSEALELEKKAHFGASFYLDDSTEDEHYKRLFRGEFDPDKSLDVYRKHLDACCWVYILDRVGVDRIMDKTAKDQLRASLASDVPEISFENVSSTIEQLLGDAELIFKRGIAVAFSALDRRFKSHDGFKIGSRIILTRVFSEWGGWNWHNHHQDTLMDIERVFAVLDGVPPEPGALIASINASRENGYNPCQSVTETPYLKVRGWMNGNAHLCFPRKDLVEKVNQILAEFYGEVLADGMGKDGTEEDLKHRSHLPAKDLQFYATPPEVVDIVLDRVHVPEGARVLEPSAGEGNMAFAVADKGAHVLAIEIHPERAATIAARKHPNVEIKNTNFLTFPVMAEFDFVFMNPPFYGVHYMDHVIHAYEFLKPGGTLLAILPVTAELGQTKKHKAFRKWVDKVNAGWFYKVFSDLPDESFASSGTRINTVTLELRKPVPR